MAGIGSLYLSVARAAGPARATHAAAIATAAMAAVALAATLAAYSATRPRASIAEPTAGTVTAAPEEHPTPIATGAA